MARSRLPFWMALLVVASSVRGPMAEARAAEMAMGFRVGEVTHDSAIVWARITRDKNRTFPGRREPTKLETRVDQYTLSDVKVQYREGDVPGAIGQVRLILDTDDRRKEINRTDWITVE